MALICSSGQERRSNGEAPTICDALWQKPGAVDIDHIYAYVDLKTSMAGPNNYQYMLSLYYHLYYPKLQFTTALSV